MNAPSRLTSNDGASALARVLSMLNMWFRYERIAPSYRQIAAFASVGVSRVRTHLDQLEARGHLTHTPGVERSVVMTDRCANISDEEMIRAFHGRNIAVVLPPDIAAALGYAYPVDPTGRNSDIPTDLVESLKQVR